MWEPAKTNTTCFFTLQLTCVPDFLLKPIAKRQEEGAGMTSKSPGSPPRGKSWSGHPLCVDIYYKAFPCYAALPV